jgi:hypothetical protein
MTCAGPSAAARYQREAGSTQALGGYVTYDKATCRDFSPLERGQTDNP